VIKKPGHGRGHTRRGGSFTLRILPILCEESRIRQDYRGGEGGRNLPPSRKRGKTTYNRIHIRKYSRGKEIGGKIVGEARRKKPSYGRQTQSTVDLCGDGEVQTQSTEGGGNRPRSKKRVHKKMGGAPGPLGRGVGIHKYFRRLKLTNRHQ